MAVTCSVLSLRWQAVPFLKDVVETDQAIVLKADAPGLTKDDIQARAQLRPQRGAEGCPDLCVASASPWGHATLFACACWVAPLIVIHRPVWLPDTGRQRKVCTRKQQAGPWNAGRPEINATTQK